MKLTVKKSDKNLGVLASWRSNFQVLFLLFILISLIVTVSCNNRGQNPTTEQMMARADSIDSVMNLREQAVIEQENERLRDSAEMMAAYLDAVEHAKQDSIRIANGK